MTVELLQKLSTISFVIAAVFFLAAAALFFLLDIPGVIGVLSGATARKGVEAIRRQNEAGGDKAHRPSVVNSRRGKVTDRITRSGRLVPGASNPGVSVGTDELVPPAAPTSPEPVAEETTDLGSYAAQAPIVPAAEETIDLGAFQAQTPPDVPEETTDLRGEADAAAPAKQEPFSVDVEINFTDSAEFIE